MIEKHKSVEVSVNQNLKLTHTFENCVSRHKISQIWVRIQTIHDTKNSKMK